MLLLPEFVHPRALCLILYGHHKINWIIDVTVIGECNRLLPLSPTGD